YAYAVSAVVNGVETLPSPIVTAVTVPNPPTVLTGTVLVTWSPLPGATGYKLYRGIGAPTAVIDVGNVMSFLDLGLDPGTPAPLPTTSDATLKARNEVQEITVNGAVGGSYSIGFTFDINGNGAIDLGEDPSPVSVQATADGADMRIAL